MPITALDLNTVTIPPLAQLPRIMSLSSLNDGLAIKMKLANEAILRANEAIDEVNVAFAVLTEAQNAIDELKKTLPPEETTPPAGEDEIIPPPTT